MAQRNNRLVYFLGFLVIVLPVIAGILVWQLVPGCKDGKSNNNGCQSKSTGESSSTVQPLRSTESPQSRTTIQQFEDGPWKNLRLPDSIKPLHYDISLFPDFYDDHETFYGNITTELKISKATSVIMVHIKYLDISSTSLFSSSDNTKEILIKRTFSYEPNEFWVVETNDILSANSTVFLCMTFSGNLTRSIVGFYKSTYVNALTNKSSSIATTKFEPVAARRAFPCFDEPSIKSEYTVQLIHKPDFIALSNMDVQSTDVWEENNDLYVTKFNRSRKMSTYLACFIVCDFKNISSVSNSGIKVSLYAPSDRVNQTQYALEVAMTTVDLYTRMFNVSYPLPKLDLISIPDFVSGAMENWGLITFRETNILYDPSLSSTYNKQRVATVVAHEVSHQWFGNLVTMAWWEDLWLNEGFASFIEYIGAAEHEPHWELLEYFLIGDLQPVMVTDAGISSHPIVVHVTDPSQINSVFDSISYSKGCSIVRMLQNWMGKDAFFSGVSRYLNDYSYQNARTDNLWTHLGNVENGISVKSVMDTWTKQMGLPYINVTITGSSVTLTQDRFLADSSIHYNKSDSEFGYTWYIKLDYTTNTGEQGEKWMKKEHTVSFVLGSDMDKDAEAWIKFNLNETGFYRVNYPEFMWKRLSYALKIDKTSLTIADRSNLIDDVFNIARAGLTSYQVALDMTVYLDTEEDYLPWKSAQRVLAYISSMLEFTGDHSLLQEYKVSKISTIYDKLGWNSSGSHVDRLLRSLVISLACGNGHEECLNQANAMFKDWLYNGTEIDPDLRSSVYTYGMRSVESSNEWMLVWNKYLSEPVPQEKSKLRSALAKTRSTSLLMRYIEFAKNKTYVRDQDYFTVLGYIADNPVGRSLVWNWVRDNWQYLVKRFTLYSRYFGRLIPAVVSDFNTDTQLDEVKSFFLKYPDAGAGKNGRKQALESIERNINWMKINKDDVISWLQAHVSNS